MLQWPCANILHRGHIFLLLIQLKLYLWVENWWELGCDCHLVCIHASYMKSEPVITRHQAVIENTSNARSLMWCACWLLGVFLFFYRLWRETNIIKVAVLHNAGILSFHFKETFFFHKGKVCEVEKWGENHKNIPFSITSYVLLKVSPTSCWLLCCTTCGHATIKEGLKHAPLTFPLSS